MFRRTSLVGTLAILVIAAPAWAQNDDKDKAKQDKPATPAEELSTLAKEYGTTQQEYVKAMREAKTPEERQEAAKKAPRPAEFAAKFLAIAEKNPKDPVAVDALIWVLNTGPTTPQGRTAVKKIVEEYPDSDKIAPAVLTIARLPDGEESLKVIIEKNKNRQVLASAKYGLGQGLVNRSFRAAQEKKEDEAKKLGEEARPLFRELLNDYLDVRGPTGSILDTTLGILPYVPGSSEMLRDVLKKDLSHEVQGKLKNGLAQVLKTESEKAGSLEASKEAESLLQEVIDNFADVRSPRGTLADTAKSALTDIQLRGIGKPAPEIEAEDIDGQSFKLSDYRGKVVFLDFWGHW